MLLERLTSGLVTACRSNRSFPAISKSLERLQNRSTINDGEINDVDENGIPRFQLLQRFQKQLICAGQRSFLGVITISKPRYLISSFFRRRSDDYERLSAVPFSASGIGMSSTSGGQVHSENSSREGLRVFLGNFAASGPFLFSLVRSCSLWRHLLPWSAAVAHGEHSGPP
jgi:hypothetical protein